MLTVKSRLAIILAVLVFVPTAWSYLENNDPCTTEYCVWIAGFGFLAVCAALGLFALYHALVILEGLWMSFLHRHD
ncbi:hypothetical protein PWG15_07040 [Ensifer adhaerens]|uniref:hypothetical protein n=1 Tax=Ensifer adhaerens TaxID=106592 RepID=UPI0023A9624C|nr:hypothetical protein [Ensifer adhaerens]WDZ78244.1 hypothetical protein PWG15_07040 [Ensifer adhaerens]